MQVKISQAQNIITSYIKAKLVPMLVGSPGVGKSAIIHEIAKHYNLKVIDLRLSQCDPSDLLGFPTITGNKSSYKPMATFPIEGDPVPAGYSGWMLFLDEFNSAPPAVQAASYKLVLDRMIGEHHLHKQVAIVCAGNLETDNAIVQTMSTALQSRLVHLELAIDAKEWCDWAMSHGIDHRITSYIEFKPSALYTFKPDHSDKTYACPRTWEFTNRLMEHIDSPGAAAMFSGVLSEGVAREFLQFTKIYDQLPKMEDIEKAPTKVAVPNEPSILYAITGSLAEYTTHDNVESILQYTKRLPAEFQIIMLKSALKRHRDIQTHPAFKKWMLEFSSTFM